MYNDSSLNAKGTCILKLRNPKNRKKHRVKFYIVDGVTTPILGAQAIQHMELIKVQPQNILQVQENTNTLDKFKDVFEGQGTFSSELNLEIDSSIHPVKSPLRRVPIALRKPLKEELIKLESKGIIQKVETPTDWISSLVVVKKPSGKLRLCIDPKPLNKALKRNHYPLPIIEDLLPELRNAKVFSLCDVKDGYWHVKLSEPSSYLTTFETPYGRYRWLRMPFGISPASEYFQYMLDQTLEGLPGIHTLADDILVTGEGETHEEAVKDHDRKLEGLLSRCRSKGIRLNRSKLKKLKTTSVTVRYVELSKPVGKRRP